MSWVPPTQTPTSTPSKKTRLTHFSAAYSQPIENKKKKQLGGGGKIEKQKPICFRFLFSTAKYNLVEW